MQPPYPNQPYPPQPSPYGRPPMASQPYGPPPMPQGPKKSRVGLVLGIVGGLFLLFVVGGAVTAYFVMHSLRSSLPLDAKQLPAQTREIHTAVIDGAREPNKRVKAVYLAAELGQHFCGGRGDPAARLEMMGSLGPHSAKEFFDPANLDKVRAELQCGGELAKSLDDDRASFLVFDDEDSDSKGSSSFSGKHYIKIGHFKMKAPPPGQGFTSVSFGALPGFCQTAPPSFTIPSAPEPALADAGAPDAGAAGSTTTSCGDKSYAAFAVGNTWFFGNKASLDELSKGVVVPKTNVGSRISALQDAVAQTSNLSQVSLVAEPKSSKEFLQYPCEWAVSQIGYAAFSSSYGSGSGSGSGSSAGTGTRDDFMGQCFPAKSDSKLIEEIDAKLRAIAFETDPDYVKAGAITGNIVLVTRDAEAAKDAERDVKELVGDWKSQIELNAPKLIKKAKEKATTPREKKFADIADTYFQALSMMKVSRSDRSIKISYKASFTKEDRQELEDEEKSSDDKRLPVVDILEAIRDKKPIPQASLAKLVGPTWAAYLVLPPLPPKAPSPKVTLTATECRALQSKLQSIKIGDIPSDAAHAYLDQKYATCELHPPEVTEDQRTCLAAVVTATDYGKCVSTDTTDPRQPPESDYGTKKKDKGSEL